jgi:transposase
LIIGKNAFHVVGQDERGAIVLHQKWSGGQLAARFASMPPCLVDMEACVGAHHLSRRLKALGHDARLMPAKYVRPYSKGQKNDFRDAEAPASPPWGNTTAEKNKSNNPKRPTTIEEQHLRG